MKNAYRLGGQGRRHNQESGRRRRHSQERGIKADQPHESFALFFPGAVGTAFFLGLVSEWSADFKNKIDQEAKIEIEPTGVSAGLTNLRMLII